MATHNEEGAGPKKSLIINGFVEMCEHDLPQSAPSQAKGFSHTT